MTSIMLTPEWQIVRAMEQRVQALAKEEANEDNLLKIAVTELDVYARTLNGLPRIPVLFKVWAGYTAVSEWVLEPRHMAPLFSKLSKHAMKWRVLRKGGEVLGKALVVHTQSVAQLGDQVEKLASSLEMLEIRGAGWEPFLNGEERMLSEGDLACVAKMIGQLLTLRLEVTVFGELVAGYLNAIGSFRETYRRELQAELKRARTALAKAKFHDYKKTYKIVIPPNKVQIITRPGLEALRDVLGADAFQVEGVLGSTERLHSAWQVIDEYAESANRNLKRVSSQRELALFMIYFERFLGQWQQVAKQSKRLRDAFT
ncbi:hypothetical protein P5705_24130 [Pseudomonas entomophila]|uniref:hypothetical protein n=1 Tax=Pseudomonas entomophila TaxID=312306 RepID=UPI0024072384|nr:hypothetical protein [Pseudomonas entomophila]MDF9620746.1 hypothetical protein [Pseudomonas entomophila]